MASPKIIEREIASLKLYERNARTHSDEQIAKIAASIKAFGFTNPVLIAGDDVLAGHGRIAAALSLDMGTVPTIDLSHLTKAKRKAYILADNRLALDAGWDDGLLKLELGELAAEGFDLALTGFSDLEIGSIMEDIEPPGEPPEPVEAKPRLSFGDHRIDITATDLRALNAAYEKHVADRGGSERGFVAFLMKGGK